MRIIFFGSDPWFSPSVLEAILKAGHQVPVVVTKGDALDEGRRMKDEGRRKIKIIRAKESKDISLNSLMSAFSLARPDAIVLAAFGPPFLAAEVLRWPKYGCLNVHASLLPRWRGASPVFAAIAAGDKETGVSIMRMTEEIDRGPILRQKKIMIAQPGLPQGSKGSDLDSGERSDPFDSRETLTKRLGLLGGELIVETLKKLQNGQINEVKQPPKSLTPYTRRLTKESGQIDWSLSPIEIERFVRAVTPWPGAETNFKFKISDLRFKTGKLKILKAHLGKLSQRDCHGRRRRPRNDVILVIDEVQLPGKNPVSWKAFLAGHPGGELG